MKFEMYNEDVLALAYEVDEDFTKQPLPPLPPSPPPPSPKQPPSPQYQAPTPQYQPPPQYYNNNRRKNYRSYYNGNNYGGNNNGGNNGYNGYNGGGNNGPNSGINNGNSGGNNGNNGGVNNGNNSNNGNHNRLVKKVVITKDHVTESYFEASMNERNFDTIHQTFSKDSFTKDLMMRKEPKIRFSSECCRIFLLLAVISTLVSICLITSLGTNYLSHHRKIQIEPQTTNDQRHINVYNKFTTFVGDQFRYLFWKEQNKNKCIEGMTFKGTCCKIVVCPPHHEILPCEFYGDRDRCSPCAVGYYQPLNVSSLDLDTSCYMPVDQGLCPAMNMIPQRNFLHPFSFPYRCDCDRSECNYFDGFKCRKAVEICPKNYEMNEHGECVKCPWFADKDFEGCQKCVVNITKLETDFKPLTKEACDNWKKNYIESEHADLKKQIWINKMLNHCYNSVERRQLEEDENCYYDDDQTKTETTKFEDTVVQAAKTNETAIRDQLYDDNLDDKLIIVETDNNSSDYIGQMKKNNYMNYNEDYTVFTDDGQQDGKYTEHMVVTDDGQQNMKYGKYTEHTVVTDDGQ